MNNSFCIRTVLDARKQSTTYLFRVLLLAASWHRRIRHHAPLEVFIIGDVPPLIYQFLEDLGVGWKIVGPDPNDNISKTSNTIVGACDTGDRRILLVDNDVWFWGDLCELKQLDSPICAGVVAGGERVQEEQWDVIADHFGFPPMPASVTTLKERVREMSLSNHKAAPMTNVYVSGGVVLLPQGDAFGLSWRRYVRQIADLFENHSLRSCSVHGSNMAGLAMAIAEHGIFQWLDVKYNYRWDCFALGLERPEQIEIVHMVGFKGTHHTVTAGLRDYWESKVLKRFHVIDGRLPGHEERRRAMILNECLEELLSLIDEYELDQWSARLPRFNELPVSSTWQRKMTWQRKISKPVSTAYEKSFGVASMMCRQILAMATKH